jgi:hypothetical protein
MPEDKGPKIDREIREGIGKLLIAAMGTTDPGMKIQFTAAVIGAVSGTLKVILEQEVPPGVDDLFGQILVHMTEMVIVNSGDEDKARFEAVPLIEKILEIFRGNDERQTKNSLVMLRDFKRIENLKNAWKMANSIYVNDNTSWAQASARLADIHPVLWEISVRHKLIVMPEMTPFDFAGFMVRKKEAPEVPALPSGSEVDWNV